MYRSNQKAWMRSDIWKEWLHYIDSGFRIQNRQVLLLVDNAASHTAPEASEIQDDTDELPLDNADADTENDSSEIERPQERSRGRPRGRRSRGRPRGGRSLGRLNITHSDRSRQTPNHFHLTNINVHFLPPNMTAHIQPMDAGIIKSFKTKYKNLYCRHLLAQFEENVDLER